MALLYSENNQGEKIIFNRKKMNVPHLLISDMTGKGKHYIVKREIISNLIYGDDKDKIIVVDTNGEYKELAENYNGTVVDFVNTFINPCDMAVKPNMTISEKDNEAMMYMNDYITSFVEIIIGERCNSLQKTIINNVCPEMYAKYITAMKTNENNEDKVINREKTPTFNDFYNELINYGKKSVYRDEVQKLLFAVKPYCKAKETFDYLTHNTTVNPDSRLIVIDLSGIAERRIPLTLQSALMYIWSVMKENIYSGAYTWVYFEELDRYFKNESLADTLSAFFKRSRLQGGIITGIVQDICSIYNNQKEHFLHLFSNAENLMFFPMYKSEAEQIKMLFDIPDSLIDNIIMGSDKYLKIESGSYTVCELND